MVVFPAVDGKPEHQELVVQVGIDCPDCGQVNVTIPGHHLRGLHQLLGSFITEFPSTHLSGEVAETEEKFNFATRGPQTPQNN
jgi:hypothetical protein